MSEMCCKKLQDYCLGSTICEVPQPFFTSESFRSLDKNILFALLKRENLQIEVVVWDYLIKWGIEQTSGLGSKNSDRTKWNDENYEALKKTLNEFIPLIDLWNFLLLIFLIKYVLIELLFLTIFMRNGRILL
jgi:hypothetical protein